MEIKKMLREYKELLVETLNLLICNVQYQRTKKFLFSSCCDKQATLTEEKLLKNKVNDYKKFISKLEFLLQSNVKL